MDILTIMRFYSHYVNQEIGWADAIRVMGGTTSEPVACLLYAGFCDEASIAILATSAGSRLLLPFGRAVSADFLMISYREFICMIFSLFKGWVVYGVVLTVMAPAIAFCQQAEERPVATQHILFVGDSFTHGRYLPVRTYNNTPGKGGIGSTAASQQVVDENYNTTVAGRKEDTAGEYGPWGGIPGIFAELAHEAGLKYDVHIEAISATVPPGSGKVVLGLLVDGAQPRLPRELRSNLRQHLYYLDKYGPVAHARARNFDTVWGMKRHIRGLLD